IGLEKVLMEDFNCALQENFILQPPRAICTCLFITYAFTQTYLDLRR
nr:hypothetical protein [Tanacetum cinerariifolium]